MNNAHSRKHDREGTAATPLQAVMPPVAHEGPRQMRDCCPTATKKLQGYFESGEKDIQKMDRWTQIHLEHCSACYNSFQERINPDFEEGH